LFLEANTLVLRIGRAGPKSEWVSRSDTITIAFLTRALTVRILST
jgi:hypothetical protein